MVLELPPVLLAPAPFEPVGYCPPAGDPGVELGEVEFKHELLTAPIPAWTFWMILPAEPIPRTSPPAIMTVVPTRTGTDQLKPRPSAGTVVREGWAISKDWPPGIIP